MTKNARDIRRPSALFIAFLLILPAFVCGCQRGATPFSSEAWKQATPDSDTRCGIADDLIKNHLRVGMSRSEVEALLGKPAADIPKGKSHPTGGRVLVYGLGRCPGQIDDEELRVILGPDGRVESFRRVQG